MPINITVNFSPRNLDATMRNVKDAIAKEFENRLEGIAEVVFKDWVDLAATIPNPKIRSDYSSCLRINRLDKKMGWEIGLYVGQSLAGGSTSGSFYPRRWETGIEGTVTAAEIHGPGVVPVGVWSKKPGGYKNDDMWFFPVKGPESAPKWTAATTPGGGFGFRDRMVKSAEDTAKDEFARKPEFTIGVMA